MCVNTEIDRTISKLAAVFIDQNIPVMPISFEIHYYNEEKEYTGLYILELIDLLDTLLNSYSIQFKIPHKKHRYSQTFKELYLENVEDGYLLPRPIIRN